MRIIGFVCNGNDCVFGHVSLARMKADITASGALATDNGTFPIEVVTLCISTKTIAADYRICPRILNLSGFNALSAA